MNNSGRHDNCHFIINFVEPRERVIDMSPEEQLAWEEDQLNMMVDFNECINRSLNYGSN